MSNWRNLLRNLALKERSREKRPEAGRCKVKAGVWFFFYFKGWERFGYIPKPMGKIKLRRR